MNPEQQRIVEDYLGRLRRAMRGASRDVIREADAEIRAHIEDALADRDEPAMGALFDVLDRLGPPEAYGRDLGLYMMVDRGYREWSLPHMIRSTVFWALTTLGGAVVVLIFGVLFAFGLGLIGLGAMAYLAPGLTTGGALPLAPPLPGWVMAVAGAVLAIALTSAIRWFVGQYVHRAGPHVGGAAADGGWARRTERRILAVAATGFGATLATGFASGAYRFDAGAWPHLPPDFRASPLAMVSGVALGVLILAPLIGVGWSVLVERER